MNSRLRLAGNYSWVFANEHYLFREANDFRRAKLQESCGLRITDDAEGYVNEHICKPNECIYSLFLFFFITVRITKRSLRKQMLIFHQLVNKQIYPF